jgi:hypothetical protein
MLSSESTIFTSLGGCKNGKGTKWRLHPLIDTLLKFSLAPSLVVGSLGEECGLKYVIFSLMRSVRTPAISDIENGRPITVR